MADMENYFHRDSSKLVCDNVHGNIYIDPLALKFIDTPPFQRLRDLKQLGLTSMVYPGAVHSRFEHSLGVYWLAGEAINKIKTNQGQELEIECKDVKAVKLAGLLHDIGHGPFSNVFESGFLPLVHPGEKWSHGEMSVHMIEAIVNEYHIDIDSKFLDDVLELIQIMVHKGSDRGEGTLKRTRNYSNLENVGKYNMLSDIVANGWTGMGADKFDSIKRDSRACGLGCNFDIERLMDNMRVIDYEICYLATECATINKLFSTRADLHRTVYTHAKVKAMELMLIDALLKANAELRIAESIRETGEFWKLNDSIMNKIETSDKPELKEAKDLILRIRRRDLYKLCYEYIVPEDQLYFNDVTPKDIVCSQKAGGVTLNEEDVAVVTVKTDWIHGTKDPIDRVSLFEDYTSNVKYNIKPDDNIPAFDQEKIVRVYSKKPGLVEAVSYAFENFQLKTHGKMQLRRRSFKGSHKNLMQ